MYLLTVARFSILVMIALSSANASEAVKHSVYHELPVKEVTVFKDGHAFVLHSGKMPIDSANNVVMDYLPRPIIGTFWPFCTEEGASLKSVVSSRRKVLINRTTLNLRDFIEANIGAEVIVTQGRNPGNIDKPAPIVYEATIIELPVQSGEELDKNNTPNSPDELTVKGEIVILKTVNGAKAVNIASIQDITLKGKHKSVLAHEEFRNLMTLKLDLKEEVRKEEAEVGMVYLQKGVRWIPHYKVEIDGNGKARLTLHATIINELADFENIDVHLVIGVPSFAFKDTIDPISLQQVATRLSSSFQQESQTAYAFSNRFMSQYSSPVQSSGQTDQGRESAIDLGPDLATSGKTEDLFLFTLTGVTLGKGGRMVVPVVEFEIEYEDVYVLDIPFTPPPEAWQNVNTTQIEKMATLFQAPKVMHNIRLMNSSQYPLTTAPALIFRNDKVLAQGMMTYTAIGGKSDLSITTAVNIQVVKKDNETERTPNAANWNGYSYGKINLEGEIKLTSFVDDDIKIEVTRNVLGNLDKATHDSEVKMVNIFEDASVARNGFPYWWRWCSWPSWWYHFNSIGRIKWNITLKKNEPLILGYSWHYFWR